jgi:hypothetical protein
MDNHMNFLTLLGDFGPAAKALIDNIFKATGILFEPARIVRKAKAEAYADLIHTKNHIKIQELQRRTSDRLIEEEMRKQENIENIINKALERLDSSAKPTDVSEDWTANFFDQCRLTSDDQMQDIWAAVLAGEANVPGTYSKRTVGLLRVLSKSEAVSFAALCKAIFWLPEPVAMVFPSRPDTAVPASSYVAEGITWEAIMQLDNAGLTRMAHGSYVNEYDQDVRGTYCGCRFRLAPPRTPVRYMNVEGEFLIEAGMVMLSQAGKELARVVCPKPSAEIAHYVLNYILVSVQKVSVVLVKADGGKVSFDMSAEGPEPPKISAEMITEWLQDYDVSDPRV